MHADFYIIRLSNDMKIAGHKNHLVGQILYRILVPIKKQRLCYFYFYPYLDNIFLYRRSLSTLRLTPHLHE